MTSPLSIAFVTRQFSLDEAGGGELWSQLLCAQLAEAGHRVDVIAEQTGSKLEAASGHLRVHRVERVAKGRLRPLLRRLRPDVVDSINGEPTLQAIQAARGEGLPVVAHANSPWATCLFGDMARPGAGIVERCTIADVRACLRTRPPEQIKRRVPAIVGWAEIQRRLYWLRRASRVIAQSHAAARMLDRNGLTGRKVRVVYNFYDRSFRGKARPDGERILSAGALIPSKGVETLLRAFALLAPRRPKARLEYVGTGFYRPHLERVAAGLKVADRVEFAGYVPYPDLVDRFRRASAFAFPVQAEESFGRVILESWGTELPIVATSVSAPGELIENERSGLLVPPADPPALAAALERVLEDRRLAAKLRAGGTQALERFRPALLVPAHESVYREAIAEGAPA